MGRYTMVVDVDDDVMQELLIEQLEDIGATVVFMAPGELADTSTHKMNTRRLEVDGEKSWQPICRCGWVGEERNTPRGAQLAGGDHTKEAKTA